MSNEIKLESWVEFYKTVFPVKVDLNLELLNNRVEILDSEITEVELESALALCKNKKAPGEDGIPSEYYKYLPQNWKLYLLSLFNKVLESGETREA